MKKSVINKQYAYKPKTGTKPMNGVVGTHYTDQREIAKQRQALAKKSSGLAQKDSYEEDKFDDIDAGPTLYKSNGLHEFTLVEFEKMKERIKILEAESVKKDDIIKKLKVENGRLRAHRNVIEGKLKAKQMEEARNSNQPSYISSSSSNSNSSNSWNSRPNHNVGSKFNTLDVY